MLNKLLIFSFHIHYLINKTNRVYKLYVRPSGFGRASQRRNIYKLAGYISIE